MGCVGGYPLTSLRTVRKRHECTFHTSVGAAREAMICLLMRINRSLAMNARAFSLLGVEPQRMAEVAFGLNLAQWHSRHRVALGADFRGHAAIAFIIGNISSNDRRKGAETTGLHVVLDLGCSGTINSVRNRDPKNPPSSARQYEWFWPFSWYNARIV